MDFIKLFKDFDSSAVVKKVVDYDKNHYVVYAPTNGNDDAFDAYYGVDKRTNEITGYSPTYNIKAFSDAFKNRVIWEKK